MSIDRGNTDTFTKDRREWIPTDDFLEDYSLPSLHDVEWLLPREEKTAIWDAILKRRGLNFDAPDIPPVHYQKLSKKSKLADKDLANIGTRVSMIPRPVDYLASRIRRLQDNFDDESYQELLLLASMTRTLVSDA